MASPSENTPWPEQTPPPFTRSSKFKRQSKPPASSSNIPRQTWADQSAVEQAETDCQLYSGNNVMSCFPNSSTVFLQNEWTNFVWNSRLPEFTQSNLVDIYLFRADSQQRLLYFPNLTNPTNHAGNIPAQVNDSWWGADGDLWNGTNISHPYYWVILASTQSLDGSEIPQSIFSAVQTTYPNSVLASMSMTSASSASSASVASLSSASSASSASRKASASSSSSTNGSIQSAASNNAFPHWAIAVIVVLGFVAIVATCILAYFIVRRIRRRNESFSSNRHSMGSASPMIEQQTETSPTSPILAGAVLPMHRQPSSVGHHAPSVVSPDGASTISGDAGPFSGADAAIMADAFRKALRKPDFAGGPVEEGDSPGDSEERKEELLNRELAEEGRDIRSVGSSRGVRVETLSDGEHTTQSPPH